VNHVTNQCKWQGNCTESTNQGDGVFKTLSKEKKVQFQRKERVTLEPFDGDHVYVSGVFRTLEVVYVSANNYFKNIF
jgi:fibrillarin-like rRNA methylase